MWCWRRMEKISWTDHVRNEEVLLRVNEQRNILHEIRKRKVNWIGHILRRNCLLKQVIEGKIKGEMEVASRRGRRCKKLLDDLKDRRGYSHLKEEALDRTMWRHGFGGGFGPVVRQNTDWMNEWITKYWIQLQNYSLATVILYDTARTILIWDARHKVRAYGRNEKCLEVYVEHLKRTDHWRDLDIEVKMVLTYHYL